MTSSINTGAAAARETARDKSNGQFGEQHKQDPGDRLIGGLFSGEEARWRIKEFGVLYSDDVDATLYEMPVHGRIDPELYEGTIAVFEGDGGRFTVTVEGEAHLELADGTHLRTPEQFDNAFPHDQIPRDGDEGFADTGHTWHSNKWFEVRPADDNTDDDPDEDDVEYALDSALIYASQLADGAA